MTRAIIKTLGVALVATLPMLASAQLTGNVSLTTNYKFRGQDQDVSKSKAVKPALQGGFDYAFGDTGWYVGNWNSSVDWLANNSLESDLYGAATMGPFTAKYSHTISKDYFGFAGAKAGSGLKGRNTGYLNFAFAQEVAPSVTVKASVGFTRFASDIKDLGVPNYMDYSVGGAYDFGGGLSLGAAVVGANKKAFFGHVNKSRVIVTLTKTL